ncbi:hypothetical protein Cylst_2119 [Cylindrospermum stagnale PCC 7417]|uniref:Uncharacterized protein n=1 Tax=Cylindrospermum stagnale PCC 7417 TaxID=56107 RepID=K9WVW7_9NOST|nr:hypothetical protein Cylst_2119 [Cylindrospermum stagnale PCC 7417]
MILYMLLIAVCFEYYELIGNSKRAPTVEALHHHILKVSPSIKQQQQITDSGICAFANSNHIIRYLI